MFKYYCDARNKCVLFINREMELWFLRPYLMTSVPVVNKGIIRKEETIQFT